MPVHASIVLAGGARTPIGRLNGALAKTDAVELGAHAVRAALERTGLEPDYIAVGNVLQAANGQNPGRRAALAGGVGRTVPGITLNDVCLASMSAVALGASMIRADEAEVVLVGGFDSMSRAPHALRLRPGAKMGDAPMIDVMIHDGLYCSIAAEGMGGMSDAENARLGISREAQDEFALESQRRAAAAVDAGRFEAEIAPVAVTDRRGRSVTVAHDEPPRPDTTAEILAGLKPAFRKNGSVTAGSSSGINDGASATVIMEAGAARAAQLQPMARIVATAVAGVSPEIMGIGPVPAMRKALQRSGLTVDDLDLIELNEAFAAQALACIGELGLDPDRVNVNGGAIALGHPLGSSGCRIVVTLAHELARRGGRYGAATMCIGVGQGIAVIIERTA
jgi:acetyl-CoA C-acetyltransferase